MSGIPVTITNAGAPVVSTVGAVPVTLVGGAAAVSAGDAIQVETQGGVPFVSSSVELNPLRVVLPQNVSIIGDAQQYQVPVVGTYTNTITAQVNADGAITGFTLS